MFRIEDVLLLKDDERVKTLARRHIVTLLPRLFLALLLIVLPFFFLFPLFALGPLGVALFIVLFGCGAVLAVRSLLLWDADVLIITNHRVVDVDQRGVFTRMVSEAPLGSIQDVSWMAKGFLESLFRMGTLRIQLASGTSTIEAKRISHPKALHELISNLRHVPSSGEATKPAEPADVTEVEKTVEPSRTEEPQPKEDTRLARIISLLETYSDEDLARIETVLNARKP